MRANLKVVVRKLKAKLNLLAGKEVMGGHVPTTDE